MTDIISNFRYDSPAVSWKPFGEGHINKSFLVTTQSGQKYVLQGINSYVFKDIPGLMKNAVAVSEHIRKKTGKEGTYLKFVKTLDGADYYRTENGEYWRSYVFVGNTVCLQLPETTRDFYESAVAFGTFQSQLSDFPAKELAVTIPDFHNTPVRLETFKKSLAADKVGRAKTAEKEIAFVLERADFAPYLMDKLNSGELPLRVTHNDTKLNNVLLDADTHEPRCVIDLDTVMPGLSAWDFGDSIRFGACTTAEDEPDAEKVRLDLEMYRAFRKGFVESCPMLTEAEREALPHGARMLCYEIGMRFLTDYLDGDVYFNTAYPEHNLVRARVQFKMTEEIEKHWNELI